MTLRPRAVALAAAAALLLQACGSEVVVRITTRVFEDGTLSRRVEIEGRTSEGDVPESLDWLAEELGLALADREAWRILEEKPGRLVAEGFFAGPDAVPAALAHRTDAGWIADRSPVELSSDDGVVYRRWSWKETYGDPFGPSEVTAAIDGIVELACEALRHEARRHLGRGVDPARGEAFLRGEARGLAVDLIEVRREEHGGERRDERRARWSEALAAHGMAPLGVEESQRFWEAQMPGVLAWLRERLARALSTPDRPVGPDELAFIPPGEDLEAEVLDLIERVWGDEEAFGAKIVPLIEALGGFYDSGNGDRYRFEVRLVMPGRLVSTNGTPTEDGVLWHLRGEDLAFREAVFEAESMEPDDEALRTLGARRKLDAIDLLRLRDLLHVRDESGALRERLREASEQGDLALLADAGGLPEEVAAYAVELAGVLAPEEP